MRARQDKSRHSASNLLIKAISGLTFAQGLIVVVGWHTSGLLLAQPLAVSVPMAYQTAVGFVLLGSALFALTAGYQKAAGLPEHPLPF